MSRVSTVWQDVRFAARLLRRAPGHTIVMLLTLALAIGASIAMFTVVESVLLRPLRYPDPDRLVRIWATFGSRAGEPIADLRTNGGALGATAFDMAEWRSLRHVFSAVATPSGSRPATFLDGGQAERLSIRTVSPEYFDVYAARPALGRTFTDDDALPGAPPVLIVSHDFWRSRLGGSTDAIGAALRYQEGEGTVVGVLPAWFPQEATLWAPLDARPAPGRPPFRYAVNARLQPGVTIDQAQRELDALTRRLAEARGETPEFVPRVESMYDIAIAGRARTVWILSGAVALVLVLACVNVAGLQLGQGAARRHELAVRASMGAGRARLVRQLLTESLLLASAGGVLGAYLAWLLLDVIVASLPIAVLNASVNLPVLAFALTLSVASGLLAGVVPALSLSQVRLARVLARAMGGQGRPLTRQGGRLLIGVEVALAMVLLAGAGLMVRSVAELAGIDLGLEPDAFLVLDVAPVTASPDEAWSYYASLLERVRAIPDVAAAGGIDNVPLGGATTSTGVGVEGAPAESSTGMSVRRITAGYFEAVGLELVAGRLPVPGDRQIAVLSEQAARRLFGDTSPLGRRVVVSPGAHDVIGVVADARYGGPEAEVEAQVYCLAADCLRSFGSPLSARPLAVVARPRHDAGSVVAALRDAARAIGPPVVDVRVRSGTELYRQRTLDTRQRTALLGALASFGLLLAMVGIAGVTSFAVARRTPEIGVRMAFGASPGDIVREMVRDAAVPVAIGLAAGVAIAYFATGVIASFLFETTPRDPLTFALVAAALGLAGCLAAWWPARRAARVDPVVALRAE